MGRFFKWLAGRDNTRTTRGRRNRGKGQRNEERGNQDDDTNCCGGDADNLNKGGTRRRLGRRRKRREGGRAEGGRLQIGEGVAVLLPIRPPPTPAYKFFTSRGRSGR